MGAGVVVVTHTLVWSFALSLSWFLLNLHSGKVPKRLATCLHPAFSFLHVFQLIQFGRYFYR